MTRISTPYGYDMVTRYGHLLADGAEIPGWEAILAYAHIHEAGHAVAAIAQGFPVRYTEIYEPRDGSAGVTVITVDDWSKPPTLAFYAAGERAVDRWLREHDLWTPEMAVMAEASAASDRRGNYSFTLEKAHDLADTVIDTHWPAIVAVADTLATARRLEGEAVGDIVTGAMGIRVGIT